MYKNSSSISLIRKLKRPVLLQGPIGGFFNELMNQFTRAGATPFKINFNGGDEFYMSKNTKNVFNYNDKMENFRYFFKGFISLNEIDGVILFGDCRPLHKIAKEIAKELEVNVFVFEEGYIRPNYITLEVGGVNANSVLMKDLIYQMEFYKKNYREIQEEMKVIEEVQSKHFHSMKDMILNAMGYWWHMEIGKKKYIHYEHHKDGDMFKSINYWVKSYFKKKYYAYKEKNLINKFSTELSKKYFLVALQVYNDSQIKDHSKFRNNKRFIFDTMKSFAMFSEKEDSLVIKQHPLDIPYHDYTKFIDNLAKTLNIKDRIFYVHDLHLPTLLKNSKGLITINSTTGLSALYHKIPVVTLGKAMYNIKGLCYQGGIDKFWCSKTRVNYKLFKKFRSFLINKTQVVGSFYDKNNYPNLIENEEKMFDFKEKVSTIINRSKEGEAFLTP